MSDRPPQLPNPNLPPSDPRKIDGPNPFTGITARALAGGALLSLVVLIPETAILVAMLAPAMGLSVEAVVSDLNPVLSPLLWYGNLLLWMAWLGRRNGLPLGPLLGAFPPAHPWFRLIAWVLAMLGFSWGGFILSMSALALAAPQSVESILQQINGQGTMVPSQGAVGVRLLSVLTLVVAAPIVEELLFRGFLLQRWAVKWGIRPAILVSSILFGLLHVNPIGLTMFGLMMAVIYIRSRQLWVTILAHSFNNAIAVLLGALGNESSSGAAAVLTLQILQDAWVIGVILVGITLPSLMFYLYQNWPASQAVTPYFSKGIDLAP